MRQVVLDTETTGLDAARGHRIIEIGATEILDRRLTERHFHEYLQPDRAIDESALEVHGITEAFLRDKPRFSDIAQDFIAFIRDAELIIHNAPFDVGFFDNELKRLGPEWGKLEDYYSAIVDTLALARTRHPGQKNNLDALCRRYNVDNSGRDRHGALLDAEILADVYLAMTGGQITLALEMAPMRVAGHPFGSAMEGKRPPLRVIHATPEEIAAHTAGLKAIDEASGGKCVWRQIGA